MFTNSTPSMSHASPGTAADPAQKTSPASPQTAEPGKTPDKRTGKKRGPYLKRMHPLIRGAFENPNNLGLGEKPPTTTPPAQPKAKPLTIRERAAAGDLAGVLKIVSSLTQSSVYGIPELEKGECYLTYIEEAVQNLGAKDPSALTLCILDKCLAFELWQLQRCSNYIKRTAHEVDVRRSSSGMPYCDGFPQEIEEVWLPRHERLSTAVKNTLKARKKAEEDATVETAPIPESQPGNVADK